MDYKWLFSIFRSFKIDFASTYCQIKIAVKLQIAEIAMKLSFLLA